MYLTPTSDQSLQVVLEVTDHEALRSLFETIEECDVSATTETIAPARPCAETSVTVDLECLTETQRETLALALEKGYYDRPRETDLDALADEFDISRSAVSQRIRTAELKLVRNAFQRFR
jgi:predicted DNA binding protein